MVPRVHHRQVSEVCLLENVTLLNANVIEKRVWDFLACPNCGAIRLKRVGKCCDVRCRVALHRWRKAQTGELAQEYTERETRNQARAEERARRPRRLKIGARSLKPLRSYNTEYHGNTLRTVNRACLEGTQGQSTLDPA